MKVIISMSLAVLAAQAQPGPATRGLGPNPGGRDLYVSAAAAPGGDGSRLQPYRALADALAAAGNAAAGRVVRLLVAAGRYPERDLALRPYVEVFGGFHPQTWQRDIAAHRTVVDAGGRGRLFRCADRARIDGLILRGGRIRGLGGALLCDGVSPIISNNVFEENETLSPQPWKPKHIHEDAHDGGAVACRNGCKAAIENNLFVRNRTENGRGGALAVIRSSPRITGNVFFENDAGLLDPMRSSDGGAVSIYDHAHPEFRGNVVAGNRALNNNDAGGVFVALWASPRIEGNVFVSNYADDDAGGLFIGGQKHHYDTPLDPLPPASEFYVNVIGNIFAGNRNSTRNSGAFRITMESRGLFANNLVFGNEGAYFQRSEIEILHNTFFDEVLVTETKDGLKPPVLLNNILWKGLKNDVETAVIQGNLGRGDLPGNTNRKGDVRLASDALKVVAEQIRFDPQIRATLITLRDPLPAGYWAGWPVQAGDHWTVIRSASGRQISLWGDHTRLRTFAVPGSYAPEAGSPVIGAGVRLPEAKPELDRDLRGSPRPSGRPPDIGACQFDEKALRWRPVGSAP